MKKVTVMTHRMLVATLLLGLVFMVETSTILAESNTISTAFVFQAMLNNSSGAVNGTCDFMFRLFDSATGTGQIGGLNSKASLTVSGGAFSTTLDFGDVFNGNPRWLETQVRCPAGSGNYSTLSPRQSLLATPYALTANNALYAQKANGDFLVNGEIRSAYAAQGDVAGAVALQNLTTGNYWTTHVRAVNNDALQTNFWDNSTKNWRFGSLLDRNGNFQIGGNLDAKSAKVTYLYSTGYLESNIIPTEAIPNGGTVVLVDGNTGNRWEIPIRANYQDSLDFWAWDAVQGSWHNAARLSKEGVFSVSHKTSDNVNILTLNHPKASWLFHVDASGHPELGIYDATRQINQWNVFDFDPATGNVGVGMMASPQYRMLVYQSLAVSTGVTGTTTLLQLHHPKSQLHLQMDENGHPEWMVKNVATDQFISNVIDINQTNGNVAIGTNATATERLKVEGNFTATGTKAATVETENFGKRKLYAVEAADVRFNDEGIGTLTAGTTTITLDPIFVETIEEPYIIHLTPYGDASLYVASINKDAFIVKVHDGDGNVQFAWQLSAPRRGYRATRLESVDDTTSSEAHLQ